MNIKKDMVVRIHDELITLHDFYSHLKDEDGLRNVSYLLDYLETKNIKI
tara:strand:- start:1136 stop:1282 length:147 start_codon:yes stop_codon:yes gene_type:complete